MAERVGIFGGTFNPIHVGHLVLAETARETLSLERVLFIPTGEPPHKSPRDLLPGALRLRLVRLAIRDHPAFVASDMEVGRAGPSYTIETVRRLREERPAARWFLIIGQDMLRVPWVGWTELRRLCTVVVARRAPAADAPGTGAAQPGKPAAGLRWLAMPRMEIASSDLRARIRAGRSIRYLVPAAVAREIERRRLYTRSVVAPRAV